MTIKKLSVIFMTTAVALSASHVYAGVGNSSGKTTCHILKNNKLVKKVSCSYENDQGASGSYMFNNFNFTIKGYKNITTIADFSPKTNANGDYLTNKDGSTIFDETITINDKPAKQHYRYIKSYKVLPKKEVKKLETSSPKNVLSCMQANDKSLELCVPVTDAML